MVVMMLLVGSIGSAMVSGQLKDLAMNIKNVFWGWGTTIQETQPLSLSHYLLTYGVGGVLAILGAVYAVRSHLHGLFLVWSGIMLLAMVGQRRWEYYAVLPLALFAVLMVIRMAQLVRPALYRQAVALLIMASLLIPSFHLVNQLQNLRPTVTHDVLAAMDYLHAHSPEPFADSDQYYQLTVLKPAYRVLSWWEYGHYIIYTACRPPVTSPSSQFSNLQNYFSMTDLEGATDYLRGNGIRYVMVTDKLAEHISAQVLAGFSVNAIIYPFSPRGTGPDAMLYRLWHMDAPGYSLFYRNDTVVIWEVIESGGHHASKADY
jgi:asparagine N-glycosylation enzyme membrane subunit Stt3